MDRVLKVLIADDSEDDALLLVRHLKKGGLNCRFERVDNADSMREALLAHDWDLVVTDHNMPAFGSAEALSLVKALQPDAPVIVVSGAITDDVAVNSMKAGAQDYIMKDNLARLVPAVERELREAEHRNARKEAEEQVAYLVYHDALTDLMNRDQFKKQLEVFLQSARVHNHEHALLYVDLDQFKIINDTCGHVAGDELLKQIGKLVKSHLREQDRVSRLGGDEFGILLGECSLDQAIDTARQLHDAIKDYRFVWNEQPFVVSSSIGVVQINSASVDVEEVLASADMACYAAKDKGRNYIQVFDVNDRELTHRRDQMHWASRIRRALDEDSFVLYTQAIVGLAKSQRHQEFLVRMLDKDNIIAPGLFMPAAERFNLMPLIDRWVIRHAFAHVKKCLERGQCCDGDLFFINLSGSSLSDESFFNHIRQCLDEFQLPQRKICFEITETTAISNLDTASAFIAEIRDLGFLFALDDFGVGMSSFAYLKAIPVDVLKIDGGFVRNMLNDPMDQAIVEACNKIAHSAGLITVAEFVENHEIENRLREIGVDFGQGYGIEKPHPIQP